MVVLVVAVIAIVVVAVIVAAAAMATIRIVAWVICTIIDVYINRNIKKCRRMLVK